MGFLETCFGSFGKDNDDDDDVSEKLNSVYDKEASDLSYVGKAAYEVLRTKHAGQHQALWNATYGVVVGQLLQTPPHADVTTRSDEEGVGDPGTSHSDWFAHKMGEVLGRTEIWADVMSLAPPDGLFMEKFQEALQKIAIRANADDKVVTVRMMFGNIIGMPLNCNALILKLAALVPADCQKNLHLWVGAWRKGVSWNHAKIIAVDGMYLITGGHNMWDYHYLKDSPVYDLSLELKGPVAKDGHEFANDQWEFVESVQSTFLGELVDKLPDNITLIARTRVAVSEFPKGETSIFPPLYKNRIVRSKHVDTSEEEIPMLTMGRYGSMLRYYRPADDAFLAMFGCAKKIIRLALQDLGPVCIPNTSVALPGCMWPKEYLTAFGSAIMRGVDVEIILSNPASTPGGLSPLEACYGNGWSCVDVTAEIIKCIKDVFPGEDDESLRSKVENNLRVCFIKRGENNAKKYCTGMTVGLHSKHFIIDDQAAYIGSQNLYICDLAEWGVLIDHEQTVNQMIEDYWMPIWKTSFTGTDVDVEEVMNGLSTNRDGEEVSMFSTDKAVWLNQQDAARRHCGIGRSTERMLETGDRDLYYPTTESDDN